MADFDVIDFDETDHVAEGETAPDFTRPLVNAEYWGDSSLSDLTDESPVLLVFYPMNRGGKAIYLWNEVRERGWGGRDLTVVGISIATPFDHIDFIRDRDMDYALFSDPSNAVAETYGVAHDLDGMTGISEPRPSVFLIDTDRTVRYAWVADEWPEMPEYDEIEAEIESAEVRAAR